jgi:hypothetical protein
MTRKLFIFCLLCCSFFAAFSQSNSIDPRIQEVYGNDAAQLNSEQLQWLNTKLSRASVLQQPYAAGESLPKLSSLKVITKYVPGLKMETSFDPAKINPLKYYINFYSKTDQLFRIDGTDFVLLIKKKE